MVFAAPLQSAPLFFLGAFGIGLGGGLFSVGTLTAAMKLPERGLAGRGLVLGAWGAAQATAAGSSVAIGGLIRDGVGHLAMQGAFGPGMALPSTGYSTVYHLEIALLFATLVVLGPLVRTRILHPATEQGPARFGLAEFPT